MLKRGDRVVADAVIQTGYGFPPAAEVNDRGTVTASGQAYVEVKWDRTGMLTVTPVDQIGPNLTQVEPEPEAEAEAPPVMGWFASLAEQNIVYADELTTTPEKDRHIAIAQVYASLENAAALDRLALAVYNMGRK